MDKMIEYFGDRLVKPAMSEEVLKILPKISPTNQKFLFEVGLPEHTTYAGRYIPYKDLELINNQFLKLYTRKGVEHFYFECLNIETNNISFFINYEEEFVEHYLNKDLEAYLMYVKAIEEFKRDFIDPEKYGSYWRNDNHEKYAKHLKQLLEAIDESLYPNEKEKYGVEKSSVWMPMLNEMDEGTY